jgi:protein-S-isoprenylcysteine O-methyltransferase Ste14
MTVAVAGLGLLVFALGALGLARPATLMGLVERPWQSRAGMVLAVAIRVVFGVVLLAAASSTRFPWWIGGLGALSLIAAGAIPVLGYARLRRFVDWWAEQPAEVIRAASALACCFGAFLILATA